MVSISLSQIFLSLSLICWIFVLIQERPKPFFPSFFWFLIVYSGLSLVSSFLSVNPGMSLKDSREILLFLIVPIVYTGFTQSKTLKKANLALLVSGLLSCLYSLFYSFLKASPGERISGFMGHYMTQAGLLVLFICMALSFLLFSRDKIKYVWGVGLILSLFALTLTLTRSAWVGVVMAVSFILFLHKPKTIVLVPLVLGLFFLLSPQYVKKRALSIFSLKTSTNQQRIEYLKAGIKIIGEFPLFGTGPDTVDLFFQNPKYKLSEESKRNVHLHNNFTQIAAERGIPTLLAWLVFLIWAFISLLKLLKNKDPTLKAFTAAALSGLLALLTAGLFEYNFGDSEITTLFLYILTIPFSLAQIQKNESIT
jgi:O-antigen ligase